VESRKQSKRKYVQTDFNHVDSNNNKKREGGKEREAVVEKKRLAGKKKRRRRIRTKKHGLETIRQTAAGGLGGGE